jgi:hypothetical protein
VKRQQPEHKKVLGRLPDKVRREIATLKSESLVKYHDEQGRRLHRDVLKAEMQRRLIEHTTPNHPNENPILKRQRERAATRMLGAPPAPKKVKAAAVPRPAKPLQAPKSKKNRGSGVAGRRAQIPKMGRAASRSMV